MPKPAILEDSDIEWLIKITSKGPKHALRNVALCYTLFGTGLTPSEIALLRVSDYLTSDGAVAVDSEVRAEIAFNDRSRPLCWTNKKLVKAIDAYLTERIAQGLGQGPHGTYRGLAKDAPLFLGRGQNGFTFRKTTRSGKEYFYCASLANLYRELLKRAGIEGATTESGRRTVAVKMHRKGVGVRTINEVLGQVSLTATKRLVEGDPVRLGNLLRDII